MRRLRLVRCFASGLGCGSLLIGAAALWAAVAAEDSFVLFFLLLLGSVGWFCVAFLGCAFHGTRGASVRTMAFLVPFLVSVLAAPLISQVARSSAFARLARRSRPLVEAIEQYHAEHGRPPRDLAAIVPEYLDSVPGTGLAAYPDYEYEVVPENERPTELVWYDLGSRDGREMTGLWVYIDGDPEHAILAIEVNSAGAVLSLRADRMPSLGRREEFQTRYWGTTSVSEPFDPVRWAEGGSPRMYMVYDIGTRLLGENATRAAALELLGPPDGERALGTTPWELRVPCFSFMQWDVFVYWPTKDYPDHMYGGWVERIEGWAYVHE